MILCNTCFLHISRVANSLMMFILHFESTLGRKIQDGRHFPWWTTAKAVITTWSCAIHVFCIFWWWLVHLWSVFYILKAFGQQNAKSNMAATDWHWPGSHGVARICHMIACNTCFPHIVRAVSPFMKCILSTEGILGCKIQNPIWLPLSAFA